MSHALLPRKVIAYVHFCERQGNSSHKRLISWAWSSHQVTTNHNLTTETDESQVLKQTNKQTTKKSGYRLNPRSIEKYCAPFSSNLTSLMLPSLSLKNTTIKVSCRMQWTVYKHCLTLKPDDAYAYYGMGNVYRDQGQLQNAMDSFKHCLTLKPDCAAAAYYRMGTVYYDQGQLQDAMDSFRHCLTLKPDDAAAYYGMGTVYRDQGQLQDAMYSFKHCLTLKPDYAYAYYGMGNCLPRPRSAAGCNVQF